MMIQKSRFLIILSAIVLLSEGCRQAKYVPDGAYLLKSNEVFFEVSKDSTLVLEDELDQMAASDLLDFIRPEPNKKFKLLLYNRVDSARYERKVEKRTAKYLRINKEIEDKENKINKKRIDKARRKGSTVYKHKTIEREEVKYGFRSTIRNKMGQAPILLDTFKVRKSTEQLRIFMRKQGYFSASVRDSVISNERKKKAWVQYVISPGRPHIIRSVGFDSIPANKMLMTYYTKYLKHDDSLLIPGMRLVEPTLDLDREKFTHYCRNECGMFGFNKNYVTFEVDTTVGEYQADVTIFIKDKYVPHPNIKDSTIKIPHLTYQVASVTFNLHNPDSISFKDYDAYLAKIHSKWTSPYRNGHFILLDTTNLGLAGKYLYNEKPFIKPQIVDFQNFLEVTSKEKPRYYKDYYVDRTYGTLNKLDIFSSITPYIELDSVNPKLAVVHVRYDLVPAKKQSFLIEPRASNTNGILGINGTVSYGNKNVARGAQRLKISFTGSLEAQPDIAPSQDTSQTTLERVSQYINTFEWGPVVNLRFPKLWPLPNFIIKKMSKRSYPTTNINAAVNFQRRSEFSRQLAELSHEWSFKGEQTKEFKYNLINFKYVQLNKTPGFIANLATINDPGLINSYSNHFTTLVAGTFHYNNTNSEKRRHAGRDHHLHQHERKKLDVIHDFTVTITESGGVIDLLGVGKNHIDPETGLRTFLNIPYTQFVKFDAQYIYNYTVNKKHNLVFRLLGGLGNPYRNSPSLPYEQSFFAGGSNDIRAFVAKSMAPGGTRKYEDLDLTRTQIGDIKMEANLEWRFNLIDPLEGALFVDAGNIWMLAKPGTPVGDSTVFRWNNLLSQTALGTGFGLRADLGFLIVRLDMAFPLYNPYLPATERWITDKHTTFFNWHDLNGDGDINYNQITKKYDEDEGDHPWSRPFSPKFVFGIGYPF